MNHLPCTNVGKQEKKYCDEFTIKLSPSETLLHFPFPALTAISPISQMIMFHLSHVKQKGNVQ